VPVYIGMIDLTSACQRTADVLAGVTDEQLALPTPCEQLRLDELVAHVGGLATAFTAAAGKDFGPLTDTPPTDGAQVDPDWRAAYPERLAVLAQAWRDPDAWQGMTRAGGIDLPGEVAGSVALAEVVIHGWDVARTVGRPYDCDPATAQACLAHLAQFDTSGTEGMFGPAVPIADDAPELDRVIALSGRDPAWRAP
jgi:uncharacterized protein (TIGR03086 family)